MNRRYYDNTLEDQQLAEIAEKARIRAGQKDSRVEGYRPGAVKGFKTSKELSDEELEGLDVFDPENPPKAEPRPLPEGIIYDSGWQEPANGRRKGWENSQIEAPLAPGLRAKPRGFEESDLPDVVPPGEGDPNFRGPPRPAPGADGEPTFKDKPDGEQYLTKEQKQAAKAPLYAYLQDKMARRQRATSGEAYDNIEKGIIGQRAQADSGALLGALSQGASMMGTLGGKRAESTIVPTMTKNLNDSSQVAFDNWRGMRGIEEASNANDLNVAKYISGLDQFDEEKKLKIRELYDRAAARRNGTGTQWQRDFEERKQRETERHNLAVEARNKGIVGPNWEIIGESPNGVIMANPKNPEEQKTIQFPTGFGPRAAKGDPTPKWTVQGQDEKGGITYGRSDDPSQQKTVQLPPGSKPKAATPKDAVEARAQAAMAADFAKEYVKKTSIASAIDGELKELKRLLDSGQHGLALQAASSTMKLLNSTAGQDAVGVEEAARMGTYLQLFQNPLQDGSFYGPDLNKFYDQLSTKSQAVKNAAAEALSMSKMIREKGISGIGEPGKGLTEDDHVKMLKWAQENPNDPRSAKIIEAQKLLKPAK